MISDPSVLVVDEPTSGLDSFLAASIMECLTSIARTGRTVIVTIHQPRSEIVKAFDNLTVLAKGGAVVFSGRYEHAVPWFEAHGHPLPSKAFNPADHILDVVSVDSRPGREEESASRVGALIAAWAGQADKVDAAEDRPVRDHPALAAESRFTPFHVAFPVVLQRMVLNLWRQREAFFNRLTQAPLLGVLFREPAPRPRFPAPPRRPADLPPPPRPSPLLHATDQGALRRAGPDRCVLAVLLVEPSLQTRD